MALSFTQINFAKRKEAHIESISYSGRNEIHFILVQENEIEEDNTPTKIPD